VINSEIRRLIHSGATEEEIEKAAFCDHDMLFQNGRRFVNSGQTSPEEVLLVCRREAWSSGGV
jgi:general secretion pathway protein E